MSRSTSWVGLSLSIWSARKLKISIDEKARAKSVERHAWRYLQDNLKALAVRRRLDLIFHTETAVRVQLDKDYELRNEAAHNYRHLPKEAKDVSAWLLKLEGLVEKF